MTFSPVVAALWPPWPRAECEWLPPLTCRMATTSILLGRAFNASSWDGFAPVWYGPSAWAHRALDGQGRDMAVLNRPLAACACAVHVPEVWDLCAVGESFTVEALAMETSCARTSAWRLCRVEARHVHAGHGREKADLVCHQPPDGSPVGRAMRWQATTCYPLRYSPDPRASVTVAHLVCFDGYEAKKKIPAQPGGPQGVGGSISISVSNI